MRRPFLAPEILQISSMDCGVAALTCMLSGYGIDSNYEKLREACQTQVDGTSIDALEDLCRDLGLDAYQHVVPQDLVVDAMQPRMPLIAVGEPSPGRLHYSTVWRQIGDLIQVMDPRGGRAWIRSEAFASALHRHVQRLPEEDWKDWFGSSSLCGALQGSARKLLSEHIVQSVCIPILESADARAVGALDASLRLIRRTVKSTGQKSRSWCDALFQRAMQATLSEGSDVVPQGFWAIRSSDGEVTVEGAVLLAVDSALAVQDQKVIRDAATRTLDLGTRTESSLPRSIQRILGPEANWIFGWIAAGAGALAVATAFELLLYRIAVDLPRVLTTPQSRIGASLGFLSLIILIAALELGVSYGATRLGRLLELKLRMKTLWSIARVEDEFINSRPTSDLAYRAHALSLVATLIPSLVSVIGAAADLVITFTAMSILDRSYAVIAAIGSLLFVAVWLTTRTKLQEVDTRLQVHASRLLNILLDAMRGIRPVRLHGYQDAFRDDQQREIAQWKVSAFSKIDATSRLESQYSIVSVVVVSAIFGMFLHRGGDARQFVVLAFWSFRIPPIVRRLVQFAQAYPLERNAFDRLTEVTQQELQPDPLETDKTSEPDPRGVSIQMHDVSLMLGGHNVLENVTLDIPAGQHVAVVGASGSGKSSLISLLLGLHQPSSGLLSVDGKVVDSRNRQALRDATMWIDPAIQLWNESLGSNLDFACRGYGRRSALSVLENADLLGVLASVDRGLDAPLGAEGAFISGGEGQRVRVGRALFRAQTRLALLDEPFRGLDRSTRRQILMNVRGAALRATMLFVSHDVSQALLFERVLVVDSGRIVEDGSPQELSSQNSHFARLLKAEQDVIDSAWSGRRWRRLRVSEGHVNEVDKGA